MIKVSQLLSEAGPLRVKSQTNGVPKLQGFFTLHHRYGFPIDISCELAKDNGWEIDWVEALADAARHGVTYYENLMRELEMFEYRKAKHCKDLFIEGLMASEGMDFAEKAKSLYQQMRTSHLS